MDVSFEHQWSISALRFRRDERYGWYVFVIYHWAVEVFCYLVWEAFYTWKLWWIPPASACVTIVDHD